MQIDKKILNVRELISYTGLSKSTIYSLVKQKKIKGNKPTGRRIFFQKSEVDQYFGGSKMRGGKNV